MVKKINKNSPITEKKLQGGVVKKIKNDFLSKVKDAKHIEDKKTSISGDKQKIKKKLVKIIPPKEEEIKQYSESENSQEMSYSDKESDKNENGNDVISSEGNGDETEEENNDVQMMDSDNIENNKVTNFNTKNIPNIKNNKVSKQQQRIMVNNLPMDITIPDLLKLFSDIGPIIKVIISNPDTFEFGLNKSKDSLRAVIIFKNTDSIKIALQYNETNLKGNQILITNLTDIPRKKMNTKIRFPPNVSIYIKNLNSGTNEEHIKEFFSSCGEVKDILLKENGQACLRFNRTESIPLALALNHKVLNESKILIFRYKLLDNASTFKIGSVSAKAKFENNLIKKIENKIMWNLKKSVNSNINKKN